MPSAGHARPRGGSSGAKHFRFAAACLLASSAWAAAPSARAAEPESEEARADARARELTARATDRFERGDYLAAAAAFQEAYELLEGDPRQAAVLNNIAVCYQRAFRYDLALVYYRRYLEEGSPEADDRAEVEQILAGLRALLGELTISSNVAATLWVDGVVRFDVPGKVMVTAGEHVLEATAPDHRTVRRQVQVSPGSQQQLHLELEPTPRFEGTRPAYFWTGCGLTAASLVVASSFGLRAVREDRRLDETFSIDAPSVNGADSAHVDRLQRSADVAFGVAALLGVSTVVLGFLTDWDDEDASSGEQRGRRRELPQLSVSGLGVSLRGEFP